MRKPVITNLLIDCLVKDEISEEGCLENKVDVKFQVWFKYKFTLRVHSGNLEQRNMRNGEFVLNRCNECYTALTLREVKLQQSAH